MVVVEFVGVVCCAGFGVVVDGAFADPAVGLWVVLLVLLFSLLVEVVSGFGECSCGLSFGHGVVCALSSRAPRQPATVGSAPKG